MAKLGLEIVGSLTLAAIFFACASDPPPDFVPPGGQGSSGSTVPGDKNASSSGGSSGASSSGGASSGGSSGAGNDGGSSGTTADCSKMGTVDSRPACDTCTKQKCCSQLQACAASASCKAAQDCIAKCADDDFGCVLTCSATGGNGAELLQDVGTCASNSCKTECPSAFDFDGGFPF
jgi:hypothetical protein